MKCPEELRTMTLGVIPKSFEDELMHKEAEYPTWRSLLVYCRVRTRNIQHRAYEDLVRHPTSPTVRGSVHSFQARPPHPSDGDVQIAEDAAVPAVPKPPTWASDLINAVRELRGSGKGQGGKGKGKGQGKGQGRGQGKGQGKGPRFIFPGCWECGEEDHQRHECPKWKQGCGSNGVAPGGHKGARDKAYAKWKENRYKAKVNNFEAEAEGEWDADDEDYEYDPLMNVLIGSGTPWDDAQWSPPVNNGFAHLNYFAGLASEDLECFAMTELGHDSDDEDGYPPSTPSSFDRRLEPPMYCQPCGELGRDQVKCKNAKAKNQTVIDSLDNWAHSVTDAKKKTSQKKKGNQIKMKISNVEDLDAVKALPTDFAALARIAKNNPGNHFLKQGEQWMIMDTGANVDAADIIEHVPEYAHLIEQMQSKNSGAECASGDIVKCRGRVRVHGTMDGHSTSIQFRDMKIKMPIGSMKKRVEGADGSDVFITEGGAIMRNRTNGKTVKLYDRGGVYFAKFRTTLPDAIPPSPNSLFGRRG